MPDDHVTLKQRVTPTLTDLIKPRRVLPALVVFLLGALLSWFVHSLERKRLHEAEVARFERQALQLVGGLRSAFAVPLEVLHSLPALFDASERVSRAEFAAFVDRSLRRHPEIYALEWFPRVVGAERARMEELARADGISRFEFTRVGPSGGMLRAEARPEHFPLYYMQPSNPVAIGFDLASEAARLAPVLEARDSGRPVVSPRIRLVEDPPHVFSIAVFSPVYQGSGVPAQRSERQEAFRGVTALVVRVKPVVERALAEHEFADAEFVLSDQDAPPELRLLYESKSGVFERFGSMSGAVVSSVHALELLGRNWRVELRMPAPVPGYGYLVGGISLSALFSLLTLAALGLGQLRRRMQQALRLGQYTLDDKIGQGGMAVVYRGHHTLLSRPTAIKLVSPSVGETRLKRFEREAELTSSLTHPNTIVIYDYGRTFDGTLYYVMEYLDGITFNELVAYEGPLPAARVKHLLLQVCGALKEAHAVGLIHRDVKPANLMLTFRAEIADFVKVLDFGLVKQNDDPRATALSGVGCILGTPGFLSPESITTPEEVDARSDLYSLGAVAYLLLTGQQVFTGGTIVEICIKHLNDPPIPPAQRIGRPVSESLEAVVLKCLAKDPAERFQSAAELEAALLACRDLGEWTQAAARSWWQEWSESRQRKSRAAVSPTTLAVDLERPRQRRAGG